MAEAQWSLSSFKKQFDDQLTCSVCLDQYTNPKTLPCLHSFCLECIQPLPLEIKNGKYYISCPTCRVNHLIPQGGAVDYPNAFHINSLLDLQKKLTISKTAQQTTPSTTCSKHNDPLKVYCETCCQVICRDCTISKEHNTHNFSLITECYPKHHQQIQSSLDLIKHKLADANTAVTHLATREREVIQQGQQLKKQINTHAQQIIGQVQRSHTHLSQQVDTIVQQKTQVLTAQRQQAHKLQTQLETCQEIIEHRLKEWTKQQILTEKHTMMDEMNTATQPVDPAVMKPREKADIRFVKTDAIKKEIGVITTLPSAEQPSTATLTLQSHDDSPLSSYTLSSKRKSSATPTTTQHQLMGPVISNDSPFTLPTINTTKMRGKTVRVITGLNQPRGIAVCDNGDIVVAEHGAHCITILNKKGKKVKSFATRETHIEFTSPRGVAISIDGHFLVTDNHRIQKLKTDGVCVKSVGSGISGSGHLQFNYPQGITIHPTTGQIFVADGRNNRIQVFNNDLTFSHSISECGTKQFDWPYDVAFDNEGYLYVAEFSNGCISKLTTTGQCITRFSSKGSAPGQLRCPTSLTINNNLVYASERNNSRVSIFDTTGKFLHCFGKKGSEEVDFNGPRGIAMDTSGNLHVSDTNNNRLVVC